MPLLKNIHFYTTMANLTGGIKLLGNKNCPVESSTERFIWMIMAHSVTFFTDIISWYVGPPHVTRAEDIQALFGKSFQSVGIHINFIFVSSCKIPIPWKWLVYIALG